METVQNTGTTPEGRLTPRMLPTPQAPLEVAEVFAAQKLSAGLSMLRYWRDGWWRWQKTHWAEVAADVVADEIYSFTKEARYLNKDGVDVPWRPDKRKVSNVIDALRGVCRLGDDVGAPCWLDGRRTGELFACANGLLDIKTRKLQDRTPLYFNLSSSPADYDPDARCPVFDSFMRSQWPGDNGDDPTSRRTLTQVLGYLVSNRTDMQCILGLIGPTRSGKGTIARLVTTLLGKAAVVPLTLSDLRYDFGLEALTGKSVAIISDARTAGKDTQVAVERLLSISGEDAMSVQRKGKGALGARLGARLVYLSNEMPYLGDSSAAIARRFKLLVFKNSFLGREDRELESKLEAERSGILNRALDGLDELVREGQFTQSEAARQMVEDIAGLSSPLLVFIHEECDLAPNSCVEKSTLYQRYGRWAQENGQPQLSKAVFARALYTAAGGKIDGVRGRDGEKRVQRFNGIRLKAGANASPAEKAASLGLETLTGGRKP